MQTQRLRAIASKVLKNLNDLNPNPRTIIKFGNKSLRSLGTHKIFMLPNCETFYLWACLRFITTLFEYFVKRRKIVPVKEYHLLLCMTSGRLLTS